jgi:hypothetical protein
MNIDNLSDMQLATCVDELFKRCINSVPIKVVPMITHQQPQQEHEDELAAPVEEPAAEFTDLQVFKPEGENEAEY